MPPRRYTTISVSDERAVAALCANTRRGAAVAAAATPASLKKSRRLQVMGRASSILEVGRAEHHADELSCARRQRGIAQRPVREHAVRRERDERGAVGLEQRAAQQALREPVDELLG